MDIATIFDQAKEEIMSSGEKHNPVLWVETILGGITMFFFADFPFDTSLKKQKALFNIGRTFGLEHRDDEIRHIVFVVEVWTSGDASYKFPVDDPNHKEAISAWGLEIDGRATKQSGYAAEIIRHGDTVDLLPYGEIEVGHNKIILAFLAGFSSSKMSDRELDKIWANIKKGKNDE
jgi:hypothetical protein